MKHVLNINEGGSDNLGDQAISKSLESLLLEKGCNVETYNFTEVYRVDNFNNMNKLLNIKVRKTFFLKTFFTKIALLRQIRWIQLHIKKIVDVARNRYDLALIGGGQLILSNTIFPIAMFTWILILRLFGTKVIILGVGSGTNFNFTDRFFYKIALHMCSEIFLRDHDSITKVSETFGVRADFISDVAFCYEKIKKEQNNTLQKKLMIGIIEYPVFVKYSGEVGHTICTEEEYIKLWVDDILSLNLNFSEIILASTTSEDLIFSKKLYNYLKQLKLESKIDFISQVLSLKEYINILKGSDVVMSARMHSLILAQSLGCIVIPWKVSKKVESYEKEYLNKNLSDIQDGIKNRISTLLHNV